MDTRSRNWCFTLNNWTEKEEKEIQEWDSKYLVFGKEKGESGTPHLQGYVEWAGARKFSTLSGYCGGRLHWETRKGTAQEAATYCKKDKDIFEKGELSQERQGKRSDLNDLAREVRNGATDEELVDKWPGMFLRYKRHIEELRSMRRPERPAPIVYWFFGNSGTGKTYAATMGHGKSFYIKDGTQWWNNYKGEDVIVIDDFDGHWPYRDLLRLLDRYPYQGQTKGGYTWITSKAIIITCEFGPAMYYTNENELAQITRRLTGGIRQFFLPEKNTEVGGNTRPPLPSTPEDKNGSSSSGTFYKNWDK